MFVWTDLAIAQLNPSKIKTIRYTDTMQKSFFIFTVCFSCALDYHSRLIPLVLKVIGGSGLSETIKLCC